jgi:hypothetical protein
MKPFKTSITIKGLTFTGTFTPEEPMVMYYKDGSGHPGSPAEFEIEEITGKAMDLVDLINNHIPDPRKHHDPIDVWEILSTLCLENFEPEFEPPDFQEKY